MAQITALATFHALGRSVIEGQSVEADDPIVSGREHLFTAPESEDDGDDGEAPKAEKAAPKAEKPARTVKKAAPKADG